MKKIEDMLYSEGSSLKNLSAPTELDNKLNTIIFPKKSTFKINRRLVVCAIAIVCIMLFSLTAVGVKNSVFTGFDGIIVDSVSDAIHRESAFQNRNLSHTFSNGTTVTVSGIVVDNDCLMVFGTADKKTEEEVDISFALLRPNRQELCLFESCIVDFEKKEYVVNFDISPKKIKNCLFQIVCDGESKNFTLNPEIITTKPKIFKIDRSFDIGGTELKMEALQSNLTSCVIEYNISFPLELWEHNGYFETMPRISVRADGKELEMLSGSASSDLCLGRLAFAASDKFEPLPPETKKVSVLIKNIPALRTVPIELRAESGASGEHENARFKILDVVKNGGKTTVELKGNCMFFKECVTAELNGKAVKGKRIDWMFDEKEGGYSYIHKYEFNGEIDRIFIKKYVCPVEINKTIELK